MRERTNYLGDGAYAEFNGWDVVVYCDRENGRHYVHLEMAHLQQLVDFVRESGWQIE